MEKLWGRCYIVAQVSHTQMITSKTLHSRDKQNTLFVSGMKGFWCNHLRVWHLCNNVTSRHDAAHTYIYGSKEHTIKYHVIRNDAIANLEGWQAIIHTGIEIKEWRPFQTNLSGRCLHSRRIKANYSRRKLSLYTLSFAVWDGGIMGFRHVKHYSVDNTNRTVPCIQTSIGVSSCICVLSCSDAIPAASWRLAIDQKHRLSKSLPAAAKCAVYSPVFLTSQDQRHL